MPDRTGVEILAVFDRLIGDPAATEFARRAQRHRPLVEDLVAVLSSDERRCLTNGDVKHEHAFIGPPLRLFDFGDCLITHPFVSLDRVARLAEDHAGAVDLQAIVLAAWDTTPDDPSIPPARMASALLGAEIWLRDPPGAREMFPDAIPRWLGRFCDLMDDLSR